MAYTLSTGVMTSWNPGANGAIRSIVASPDGSRIYVAGNFTTIASTARNRIAAFNTATGALLPWNPGANAQVSDIATAGNTVWLVGNFSSVAGGARTRVAAVNATTGALLPFTASVTGGYGVKAIEAKPDGSKVVIAGSFTATNGSTDPGRGLAALNATTGASMEWKVNSVIRNAGENAAINSLASDGDSVYGTGYDFGGGAEDGFEDVFRASWTDGTIEWLTDCHGDNYCGRRSAAASSTRSRTTTTAATSAASRRPTRSGRSTTRSRSPRTTRATPFGWDPYGYRSFVGQPAGTLLHWYPEWQVGTYTGKSQAGWDVEATDDYTVVGGEFLRVNNIPQQGLVRFGKKSVGARTDGSAAQRLGVARHAAVASRRVRSASPGRPTPTATTTTLTYELFRQDKGATPICTGTAELDLLEPSGHEVRRQDGHRRNDLPVPRPRDRPRRQRRDRRAGSRVTATTTQASDYALDVLDDGAEHYWPLGETSGTLGADWAQNGDVTVNAATRGATGPNLAHAEQGDDVRRHIGRRSPPPSPPSPLTDTVSIEAWFKTTSTDGGKIVGFGNSATGNSGNYDRHLYLDGSGRVTFGVHPGGVRTLESGTGYNDGAVAPRRRHARRGRHDALPRRQARGQSRRHDVGAALHRLLAHRRRQPRRLAERRREPLPQRLDRRRRDLPVGTDAARRSTRTGPSPVARRPFPRPPPTRTASPSSTSARACTGVWASRPAPRRSTPAPTPRPAPTTVT